MWKMLFLKHAKAHYRQKIYINDYKKIRNNKDKISNNKKFAKYYTRTDDWGYTEELLEAMKLDLSNGLIEDIRKAKAKSDREKRRKKTSLD